MKGHGLPRLLSDLLGRNDRALIEIIGGQIDAAIEGAELARRLATAEISPAEARSQVSAIEHRGDQHRGLLVSALAAALTTFIDREDLFRFSRCTDDVLDGLRDFVRESDLYGMTTQPAVTPLLDMIIEGLRTLRAAVAESAQRNAQTTLTTLAAKKCAGKVRRLYGQELAELFRRPLDVDTMKRRELLRRLDVVGLRLGEAADALADGTLKRSR